MYFKIYRKLSTDLQYKARVIEVVEKHLVDKLHLESVQDLNFGLDNLCISLFFTEANVYFKILFPFFQMKTFFKIIQLIFAVKPLI